MCKLEFLEYQAINQNRLMLSFFTGRAGFREKPDSTFSPGTLGRAEVIQEARQFAFQVFCLTAKLT